MNYTIRQLQIFMTIAEKQSVSKAAEALHLSQPAVSIQLKNLQGQFDVPLTEVVGRKIFITDFGKEIAKAAEKILNEVYAMDFKTQAHKGLLSGRLKISVVSTGKYVMPYFLADFLKLHPGIELLMDVTNKTKVIESLYANDVDFSLVSVLPENLKLSSEPLMPNELFVVANTEGSNKAKNTFNHMLENMPLIYREMGSGTRTVMEKFIAQHQLPIRKKMELTSNEAVKQAVLADLGYSIMPLVGMQNELDNGSLQIIPAKGFPILSHWQLVWLEEKKFSPIAELFLQHIRQQKQHIIDTKFAWLDEYRKPNRA